MSFVGLGFISSSAGDETSTRPADAKATWWTDLPSFAAKVQTYIPAGSRRPGPALGAWLEANHRFVGQAVAWKIPLGWMGLYAGQMDPGDLAAKRQEALEQQQQAQVTLDTNPGNAAQAQRLRTRIADCAGQAEFWGRAREEGALVVVHGGMEAVRCVVALRPAEAKSFILGFRDKQEVLLRGTIVHGELESGVRLYVFGRLEASGAPLKFHAEKRPMGGATQTVEEVTGATAFCVRLPNRTYPVRLLDVQEPPPGGPEAQRAQAALAELIGGKDVKIYAVASEGERGWVARVLVGDLDVGAELIRRGVLKAMSRPDPATWWTDVANLVAEVGRHHVLMDYEGPGGMEEWLVSNRRFAGQAVNWKLRITAQPPVPIDERDIEARRLVAEQNAKAQQQMLNDAHKNGGPPGRILECENLLGDYQGQEAFWRRCRDEKLAVLCEAAVGGALRISIAISAEAARQCAIDAARDTEVLVKGQVVHAEAGETARAYARLFVIGSVEATGGAATPSGASRSLPTAKPPRG